MRRKKQATSINEFFLEKFKIRENVHMFPLQLLAQLYLSFLFPQLTKPRLLLVWINFAHSLLSHSPEAGPPVNNTIAWSSRGTKGGKGWKRKMDKAKMERERWNRLERNTWPARIFWKMVNTGRSRGKDDRLVDEVYMSEGRNDRGRKIKRNHKEQRQEWWMDGSRKI